MRLNDPIEVSYTIITVNQEDHMNITRKVSIAINVQLDLEDERIPFINSDNHDFIKSINRLVIYGPSGCGKSRIILELAREKLDKIRKIVIINPRTPIGNESGRKDLISILNSCGEKDLIIWDNFPDGMAQNDDASIRRALETISTKKIKHLLVAIKPRYLERLRDISYGIPDLNVHQISYNKESIRKVISQFGHNLSQFKELYENGISKNEELISEILWQKEPLPLTVLDYFRELASKKDRLEESWIQKNAIEMAQKLLPRMDYYDYQFELIRSDKRRTNEVEFLYVLKLCYELGLQRTKNNIIRMQTAIFGSLTAEKNIDKLGMWVYHNGTYYSMHDIPGNTIVFDKVINRKIVQYLARNFSIIGTKSNESVYLLGLFLGKNAKFLLEKMLKILLERHSYGPRNNPHFELGLGHGIGENFGYLRKQIQDEVFDKGYCNLLFMRSLGEGIGRNFLKISPRARYEILKRVKNAPAFSRGLGIGLGNVFVLFSADLQKKIFDYVKNDQQLSEGIGIGIGSVFQYLPDELQVRLFSLTETDGDFARGMGESMGHNITSLSEDLKDKTFHYIENNAEFARGFGMGLGNIVYQLPKELQKQIFLKSEHNILMSGGLGIGLGSAFFFASPTYQDMLFRMAENNDEFSLGLGLGLSHNHNYLTPKQKKFLKKLLETEFFSNGVGRGYGYAWHYLSNKTRDGIFKESAKNPSLARGLGAALGHNFPSLSGTLKNYTLKKGKTMPAFERGFGFGLSRTHHQTNMIKKRILKISDKNKSFAWGSGEGFGFSFQYLSQDLKDTVLNKSENNAFFAKGLGEGLGYTFGYLSNHIREEIIRRVKTNKNFAEGFGTGIGRGFKYLKSEEKDQLIELIQETSSLKLDQKGILLFRK